MSLSFRPSAADLAIIKKLDLGSPWTWIATLGGLGFCRPAPGTWGTLGALPLGLLIYLAGGIYVFAAAFVISLLLGYFAARDFERQTGEHDSKMVVIDELHGLWIALLPAFITGEVTWLSMMLAFILFRFFDILKPFPIGYFDRNIGGAVGVIADDIIAGQYAAICLIGAMYAGLINPLVAQLSEILQHHGLTMVTAESCTGGMIAAAMTARAGSSAVFERGFITYSNQSKIDLLDVSPITLAQNGAVSEQTAREMAAGSLRASKADLSIAVTGIAGPDGGSDEKPVGLVYIGHADRNGKNAAKRYVFDGNREEIRQKTVEKALLTLILEAKAYKK